MVSRAGGKGVVVLVNFRRVTVPSQKHNSGLQVAGREDHSVRGSDFLGTCLPGLPCFFKMFIVPEVRGVVQKKRVSVAKILW